MAKRAATRNMKNASTRGDAQLKEFMAKDFKFEPQSLRVIRPQRPTSILLDDDLIGALKKRAAKLGIGYQTLLKMIVKKHLNDDL